MTGSNPIGTVILRAISWRQPAAQRIALVSYGSIAFEWLSAVERSRPITPDHDHLRPPCEPPHVQTVQTVKGGAAGSAATRQVSGAAYPAQQPCTRSTSRGCSVSQPQPVLSGGSFAKQLPSGSLISALLSPNRLLWAGNRRLDLRQQPDVQHISSKTGHKITSCDSFASRGRANTVWPFICAPRNCGSRTDEGKPSRSSLSTTSQREAAIDDGNACAGSPSAADCSNSGSDTPSGWTKQEVYNLPNLVSFARLASGPLIAHWIVSGQLQPALVALLVAGWSDWLDGWLARRFNQQSTLGTYLDPLADKVLICCVVTALGIQGTLPQYLAAVIVGRDVFLVGASFVVRALQLGWKLVSLSEFFRVSSGSQTSEGSSVPAAVKLQPLFLSKVNTVAQLGTVSAFLLDACVGSLIHPDALQCAAMVTTATTVLSGVAYVHMYRTVRRSAA